MSWSILLGLSSSLCWGTADFVGGLQSRRLPVLAVLLWSQLIGGLVLGIGLLLSTTPATAGLLSGQAAGFCGALALLLLYRGLAVGTMSIVAPISACGAVVPVAVGLAQGERLSALAALGVVVALAGVALASLEQGEVAVVRAPPQGLALALGAALGFGLFFTLIDRATAAPGASALWVNLWARTGSLPLLLALKLLTARRVAWPGRQLAVIGLVGVLDMAANLLFALAAQLGALGVVGVLGSLYPVATVLLSWLVLGERLRRMQYLGVGLALGGVGLLAAG